MSEKIEKLLCNMPQGLTPAEQKQGRDNLGLADVAASGSYNDLTDKPVIPTPQTVNDGTLTIATNGNTVATFTANSSSNVTADITVPAQQQSNWTQTNSTAVDFIRNKYVFKDYATSYDYPDCMHVRTPGAHSNVIVYYPYEDRKKVQFVDDHVYTLKISTSGIHPQDSSIETITAKLFTYDVNRQRKYLCPSYTFKAGSSAQFDLNWVASGVLSISEALLDECAPHIEFSCELKDGEDIAIYCNGIEWHLNVRVSV